MTYNLPTYDSLDSFEGAPDWIPLSPTVARPVEAEERGAIARAGHDALQWLSVLLPGIALATLIAFVGMLASGWIGRHLFHVGPGMKSPLSPVMLAIVIGLLLRNTIGVPKAYEAGLKWCTRTALRFGIVLLGIGLTVKDVAQIGLAGLPIIVGCILATLLLVTWINALFGLPRRLGTLIAVGTSICGVSAIVATAPAIKADEDETSYAVACVTIFGLFALLTYPFLASLLFTVDQQQQVGVFLGTSIHDMAQLTGAAAVYREQHNADHAMNVAVTVKMVRNLGMSVLIPLLAYLYHRSERRQAATAVQIEGVAASSGMASFQSPYRQRWYEIVPTFVVGFVLLAVLRSVADHWGTDVVDAKTLDSLYARAAEATFWCLGLAMASVGLGTGLARLVRLGWRPFTVGCAAAMLVGGVSYGLVKLLV